MQKRLIVNFVLVLISMPLAGCVSGSPVRIITPAPSTEAGTPAPGGQIEVPGVSIQVYAPGLNPLVKTADSHGSPAGLLLGIWHGLIAPITLLLSFLSANWQMYEVHNDGPQYNLGFLIGIALTFILLPAILGARRRP